MKILYFLTALCISIPTYSSDRFHGGDVIQEKPAEPLHNPHRDEVHHRPQGAVILDTTQKENKLRIVEQRIEKYEKIFRELGEDDAALKEHYDGYIKLYRALRAKVEHNPKTDVNHEIALITRQHNLYSDSGY